MSSLNSLSLRLRPDHAELSRLRHDVSSWIEVSLAGRDQEHAVNDIAVVLTELVANAIDHTESEHIGVVVELGPSEVLIEVANDGDLAAVPPVAEWGVLAEGERGRGLRMVRAVCQEIELLGDEHHTIVRCQLPVS